MVAGPGLLAPGIRGLVLVPSQSASIDKGTIYIWCRLAQNTKVIYSGQWGFCTKIITLLPFWKHCSVSQYDRLLKQAHIMFLYLLYWHDFVCFTVLSIRLHILIPQAYVIPLLYSMNFSLCPTIFHDPHPTIHIADGWCMAKLLTFEYWRYRSLINSKFRSW